MAAGGPNLTPENVQITFPWATEHVVFGEPHFDLPGGIDLVIQTYKGTPDIEELRKTVRSMAQINQSKTPGCTLISIVNIGEVGNYSPGSTFLNSLVAALTTEGGLTNGVQGIIYGTGINSFILFTSNVGATVLGGALKSAVNLSDLNNLLQGAYRAEFSLNENLEVVK